MRRFTDTPGCNAPDALPSWRHYLFPGAYHLAYPVANAEVSQRRVAERIEVLRRALRS